MSSTIRACGPMCSVLPRLETHGDLFSAVLDQRQTLPPLR
jgi:hypothetical protein